MRLHLRDEARETERRTPVIPSHAAQLIQAGLQISVEQSTKRVFSDAEYEAAGCALVRAGSWMTADPDTTILGLKELPGEPATLALPMIHFAHLYKDQTGWEAELTRFARGGGQLYDLEYLTNAGGRRVAAFGYWAGWLGAALAIWRWWAQQADTTGPEAGVTSFDDKGDILGQISNLRKQGNSPRAIVIGAKGRSGSGATEALRAGGATVTEWDLAETRDLDRNALLDHDILVNCVLMTGPGLLLAAPEHLSAPGTRLAVISDVSCDPLSDFNPLPLYEAPTEWNMPFLGLGTNGAGNPIELTAIDNLPSLLPREASEDFSEQLLPSLLAYPDGIEWQNAASAFHAALKRGGLS